MAQTEQRINSTRDKEVESAKANAYGVAKALDRAGRSPEVSVAYTLNDRVRLALGEPPARDALEVDRIVSGLLSSDSDQKKSADKLLARRDAELVGLQDRLVKLEATLGNQEAKRDAQFLDFSGLADRFVRLRTWFWLGVGAIFVLLVGPLLFRVLAIVAPATGPVAGIFASIFASAGKTILKAVPEAAEKAGYVAAERFQQVQGALDDTVTAIQEARRIPHVREKLEPILDKATDERVSRPVIREVKQRLNLRGSN